MLYTTNCTVIFNCYVSNCVLFCTVAAVAPPHTYGTVVLNTTVYNRLFTCTRMSSCGRRYAEAFLRRAGCPPSVCSPSQTTKQARDVRIKQQASTTAASTWNTAPGSPSLPPAARRRGAASPLPSAHSSPQLGAAPVGGSTGGQRVTG